MANTISGTTISPMKIITDSHVCLASRTKLSLVVTKEVCPGLLFVSLRFEKRNCAYTPLAYLDHCLRVDGQINVDIDEIVLKVEKVEMYYNGDVVGPTKRDRVVDFTVTVLDQSLHGWFRLGDISDFVEFLD